jgi:SpoVK/Ycf46/Vps4 family AAA+-type ATPase
VPQPQQATTVPSSNVVPAPTLAKAGLKERMFAEQRERYQAGYNDKVDEVTAASADLTKMAGSVGGVQNNLTSLSKTVQHRIPELVTLRYLNNGLIAKNVVLLKPLFRPLQRAGGLLKLVVIVAFIWVVGGALRLAYNGQLAGWVQLPVILGILYYLERRYQLSAPLKALHKSDDKLKEMALAYVYDDQAAQAQDGTPACHVIRVSASSKNQTTEEYTLSPTSWGVNIPPDTFLLYVGDMAVYRAERNGDFSPLFGNPANEFMVGHGRLLTDALAEQKTFAASSFDPLAAYGKVLWRKRKASQDLPRLEKLVKDVERQEEIWRNTYVNDKVFEFLLRRIDLFNVRDSATPAGILLYGYPGNGKAHLAKKIAESISARFEQVDPATMNSASAVKALWERNRGKGSVVLFLDYAERVFPRSDAGNQGGGTREATMAWLTEWAKAEPRLSRVWVVMTAESDHELHPDILARFGGSKIEVVAPDTTGREAILRGACRANQLPDELPAWLVGATGGASIRELSDIVKETKMQCTPHPPEDSHWRLALKNVRGSDAEFRDETKTWDRLVLPPDKKDQLQRACKILQDADRYKGKGVNVPNILLFGPPGTGKTDIARTFANEGGVQFVMATTADMKAQYVGQSAHLVRAVFDKARAKAPAVLFIDEVETVAAKRGSPNADAFTQDVVTEMLAQMDGARKYDRPLIVLAATNLVEQIDTAILSRFTSKIEIPLPDAAGRREMLKHFISERAVDPALDVEAVSDELGKRLDGKSGRDLLMLVNRAMERAVLSASSPEDVFLTREFLLAELAPQAGDREAVDETATWDSLVLADETIDKLKTLCEMLRNIEVLQKQGITPPRGALLFGPPGTGKTQIARTLSNESGIPFIAAGPADIKAGYIGQSGQKVKDLFARAREKAPCILFIDEIESGAASRNSPKADQFAAEIVTQLLTEMDGVKKNARPVFVLAATNHQEMIDSAVLSRFVEKIEIPNPDEGQRQRMFEIQLAKKQVDFDVKQVSAELAHLAASYSGRDIFSLVDKASQHALGRAFKAGSTDHIVLTREDLLLQLAPQAKPVSDADLQKIWAQVILKPEIKDSILSKIRMFNNGDKAAPRGLLLYGPPGTGKTEIAKRISDSASCHFMSLKGSDLKAGYVGQSGQSVKKVWDEARSYGRCVMFIDECDAVFSRRGSVSTDSGTEEIIPEFIQSWEGVASTGQIWVIGATNQRERLDDAVVSRFGVPVEIGLPEAPERVGILKLEMQKRERQANIPDFVAGSTSGFAGRDLSQVANDVCTMAAERNTAITPEMWEEVIARFAKASSESVDEGATWGSLVLSEATLDKLQTTCVMLRHIEVLQKQGIQPPRGVLLYGPPGTGKTQIARTIANESGLPFIAAGPSDIKAGFIGQSGLKVHELFERARGKAPCVLFIDEIDSGAARRGSGKADGFTDEIVTQMLTELDGVKKNVRHVFLLAATNRPELVDEAILSRFIDKIEIPNPDLEQRQRLLAIQLAKRHTDFDVPQFAAELAGKVGEMSGRDIYSFVERASQSSLRRALKAGKADQVTLSKEDLLGAL